MNDQHTEHVKLLAIFHFVVAGLAFFFSLFPVLYLVIGVAIVTGAMDTGSDDDFPRFLGWLFILLPGIAIALGLAYTACMVVAGRFLLRRSGYLFCLVMAGLSCMFMPFGTVLGVFTLIVLLREPVREMFGVATSGVERP